ncbi:MAG: CotH kinase family protein [Rhodospirillales bacterium]|nr:CotH kinase family protein [Rhodospirillales bacterium]
MGNMKLRSPLAMAALFLGLALVVAFPALFARDIYREWRGGHVALFQHFPAHDWISYRSNMFVNWVTAQFGGGGKMGLDPVRLYISEQDIQALSSDIPGSVKKKKAGRMIYPDGSLRQVKICHRGDNPVNWLFAKKSWRVKTRKKRTIGNIRSFNYIAPQDPVMVDTYFYNTLARTVGLPAAKSRLVSMYINDDYQGVLTEVEQLDESFLRNSGFMPVNLYKGEQRMSEKRYGSDFDLFSNPALWRKTSKNNSTIALDVADAAESDLDLRYFLELVGKAETSTKAFSRLKIVAPLDAWTRFAAFEILTQSPYDARHNARLIADIWRGTVTPIIHDPQAIIVETPDQVKFDRPGSRVAVLRLYSQSSEFRLMVRSELWRLVTSRVLSKALADLETLRSRIEASVARDPFLFQSLGGESLLGFDYGEQFDRFVRSGQLIESELTRRLGAPVNARWHQAGRDRIAVDVAGQVPLGGLRLHLEAASVAPSMVYWDANANGVIDLSDTPLPMTRSSQSLVIDAALLPNWLAVTTPDVLRNENYGYEPQVRPARFLLLGDGPLKIDRIEAINALTGTATKMAKGDLSGTTPAHLNLPVISPSIKAPVMWSGTLDITTDRIIDHPVRIAPGTVIRMGPGASVIFRDKLTAIGSAEAPIKIEPLGDDIVWGTFALAGNKTSGSRLAHVDIRGGSGDAIGMLRFTAMLSIHDTSDVIFSALHLEQNKAEDDMMHVIYSQGIVIDGSRFDNAKSDAVDIDISSVRILNSAFSNSGNDAIDLMESRVVVSGVTIEGSDDKGISVGEKTDVLVVDTTISNSKIGVQSKDGSLATIVHSQFTGNDRDLNAYWKNWRYGTGGRINVDKSVFLPSASRDANISAEKRSGIVVHDSLLLPPLKQDKRVKYFDISSGREAVTKQYEFGLAERMSRADLRQSPEVRGPRP